MILDCQPLIKAITSRLQTYPKSTKSIAAVLIGDDPASESFLKQKEKVANSLGIPFVLVRIAVGTSPETIEARIRDLGNDESVGGIILQLPLPEKYDREKLIHAIPSKKDPDALRSDDLVDSPAVGTLKELIAYTKIDLSLDVVALVGRGFLIGKPIARWLLRKGIRVVVMGRESFDPVALASAHVVISGTGVPGLIRGEEIREGALCIDFGYGRRAGKLSGDFDPVSVAPKASHLTPVPGGTGPILVLKLFENFFILNQPQ